MTIWPRRVSDGLKRAPYSSRRKETEKNSLRIALARVMEECVFGMNDFVAS